MFLPWCLERLAKTSTTKNAKSLAILQSLAVYYTVLGVKRDTDMTAARKKETAAHSLKHLASSAWLSWLKDVYEFALPAWFTMDLFGQTTISGECSLYIRETTAYREKPRHHCRKPRLCRLVARGEKIVCSTYYVDVVLWAFPKV